MQMEQERTETQGGPLMTKQQHQQFIEDSRLTAGEPMDTHQQIYREYPANRKRTIRQMDYDYVDYGDPRQQMCRAAGSLSHMQQDDRSTQSFPASNNLQENFTQSDFTGFPRLTRREDNWPSDNSSGRAASELSEDKNCNSRPAGSEAQSQGDHVGAHQLQDHRSYNRGGAPSLSGASSNQRQRQAISQQPPSRQQQERLQSVPSFSDGHSLSAGFPITANTSFPSESMQQQQPQQQPQQPQQQQQHAPRVQRGPEGMGITGMGASASGGLPSLPSNCVRLISGKCGTLDAEWEDLQCILIRLYRPRPMMPALPVERKQLHSDGVSNICRRSYRCTQNSDGYRWLKYGQKLLTNSQLYREYFRCAHPHCPAKKHVEVEPSTGKIISASSTPHNHTAPVLDSPPPVKKSRKSVSQNRSSKTVSHTSGGSGGAAGETTTHENDEVN